MLIELSIGWVIALNVIAWLVIQFALAWSFTQLAPERFDYRNPIAVPRGWERSGKFYKRVFAINRWKHKLPDASSVSCARRGAAKSFTGLHCWRCRCLPSGIRGGACWSMERLPWR